jgi:hypothetical protein
MSIAILGLSVAISATSFSASPVLATASSTDSQPRSYASWLSLITSWLDSVTSMVGTFDGPTSVTVPSPTADHERPSVEEAPPTGIEVRMMRLRPRPKPGPFSLNLYSKGDFAHQQTVYWCVAAAAQTMMNIIDDGQPDRSKARQKRLHFQARRLDQDGDGFWRNLAGESRWKKGLHGLGLTDWAELLDTNGYGSYEVERARTRKQAVRMAAKAIRMTGRPVGLVVWRGAHSWVMSGFTATADPAYTDDFEVRKVFVQDPWFPS